MNSDFSRALIIGSERVAAWADLLDRINVFPVADGDTGRNLVISMKPFGRESGTREELVRGLLLSARGNSGNIVARFFSGFLSAAELQKLPQAAKEGRDLAWKAVSDPKPGTILTLLDALCEALEEHNPEKAEDWAPHIIERLEKAVRETTEQLPTLKEAGVVDAGALGMFIFFDGFLKTLAGHEEQFRPIAEIFKSQLDINPEWSEGTDSGYCIDVVLNIKEGAGENLQELGGMGESVVAMRQDNLVKIHLHSEDAEKVRQKMEALGEVVRFSADDLFSQTKRFVRSWPKQAIHIMTDAAGSVTRADAASLGMTLLDSYITYGNNCAPETHIDSQEMYSLMRKGVKVSTSQASTFERNEHYRKALDLFNRVLYLCVGAVYTGNYKTVTEWKAQNDPDNRLIVIDSKAASGQLGLAALAAARFSLKTKDADAAIAYAKEAVENSKEYIFLDKLEYLAAGGRLSKTGAFFGDLFNVKPIIAHSEDGAKKVAVARNTKEQLNYALERLSERVSSQKSALIMLEYSDNRDWAEETALSLFKRYYPKAEFIFQPVSLTSGAHMGPGTWGVSFLQLPE